MIAALALAAALGGAAPELTIALEPSEVRVGDRVTATLALHAPAASAPPVFPPWQGTWGPAEILESSPPVEDDGIWRQRLVLALFAPGEHALPTVAVEVPQAGGRVAVRPPRPPVVRVRSVLPEGKTDLEPPAPPRALPLGETFVRTAGVFALASALAAGLGLWRSRRGAARLAEEESLPPLERLRRSLAALESEERPEILWAGASLALRRYLGASLEFPAAEGTTSEIQRALARRPLPPELAGGIVGLLREADQVKFARRATALGAARAAAASARQLAEALEAAFHPPAAAGEEAA